MPIAAAPLIIFCVVGYLIVCFGIGAWAMRRTRNSADFFLAGKSLGPLVVAAETVEAAEAIIECAFREALDDLYANAEEAIRRGTTANDPGDGPEAA